MTSRPCYYALGGINLKQQFATSCPTQHQRMQWMKDEHLPSKYFNNSNFRQHRLDLLNGKWPKGCDMCQRVEELNTGISMRQETPADITYTNTRTGSTSFKGLKTIEIRFSNACNMACLHCSPAFSSGWTTKLKRYVPDNIDREHQLFQLTGDMHRESADEDLSIGISLEQALEITEDLNQNFPNLERVDFAGGEVLYQKQFFPTLKKLAEHPNAHNMYIMFHTNFNVDFDPIELNNCLEKFGRAEMKISIDSGPGYYDYFRGGDWNILKANLEKFKSVRSKKVSICLVCTTGAYQIMQFKDTMEGFLSLECDMIDASIIFTPDYLNPSIMMLHFEEETRQELDDTCKMLDAYSKHRVDVHMVRNAADKLRQYIKNHNPTEAHWVAFKEYVKKTDVIWKQDFNDYFTNYKLDKTQNRIHSNV